jgi:hypothetical protein
MSRGTGCKSHRLDKKDTEVHRRYAEKMDRARKKNRKAGDRQRK